MATTIRPELSRNNKYYISKQRYYELKHFCLQYDDWARECVIGNAYGIPNRISDTTRSITDPVYERALHREPYLKNMSMVEESAKEADPNIAKYIMKAVTEGVSFTYLHETLGMPCGKDMYYDRYRKFFWILDKKRQ